MTDPEPVADRGERLPSGRPVTNVHPASVVGRCNRALARASPASDIKPSPGFDMSAAL